MPALGLAENRGRRGYFWVLCQIGATLVILGTSRYQGLSDRVGMIIADRAHKFLFRRDRMFLQFIFYPDRNSPDPGVLCDRPLGRVSIEGGSAVGLNICENGS